MGIINEMRSLVEKFKLNPTFNNKFDIEYLKKEFQLQIPVELFPNIVV